MEDRKGFKTNIQVPLKEKITNPFFKAHSVDQHPSSDQLSTAQFSALMEQGFIADGTTRLERYQARQTIHDPSLVREMTERVLAIREKAMQAPDHIPEDGRIVEGIPFHLEELSVGAPQDAPLNIFAEQIEQAEPGRGLVLRVHRRDGVTERITFARSLNGRPVVTAITIEVATATNGQSVVQQIKVIDELSDGEVVAMDIVPGGAVAVTDYAPCDTKREVFNHDGDIVPEKLLHELDAMEHAITERRVSSRHLKKIRQLQAERHNIRSEIDAIMKKIADVEYRRQETYRFQATHRNLLGSDTSLVEDSLRRLDYETNELQNRLDQLTARLTQPKKALVRTALKATLGQLTIH
jgi:hypothetical protein